MGSIEAALWNDAVTDAITSVTDDVVPAGRLHDSILALLTNYSLPFIFAVLALILGSRNPAEVHRRGVWVPFSQLPCIYSSVKSGQLSLLNAMKQQVWQLVAAATDSWSCHHKDADYEYSGNKFNLLDLSRHSLPYGLGYIDVASPESLARRVDVMGDLRVISANRGRVEELVLSDKTKQSLRVDATLWTSSLHNNRSFAQIYESRRRYARRTSRQYNFTVQVHPIASYRLVLSWRESIFKASVIIGLWVAAMTCGMGKRSAWGGYAFAFCTFSGWILRSTMVSTDETKENVFSALPEVGKHILRDWMLAEVGCGVLVIKVTRSSIAGDEPATEQTADLLVQWRKPGSPPHYPWFGAFCGPLLPSLSVHRYLYSIIMVLSGTLSPAIRANVESNSKLFVSLSGIWLGHLILNHVTIGSTLRIVLLVAVTVVALCIRSLLGILVRRTMTFGYLSHADFEQLAEVLLFCGCWALPFGIFRACS
ncbi:hypothetical protein TRVA0_098S00100 [Trichomonascus vanleenenianus]|uniref:uncharacterized protein n=1 Tax=Trichomonascus vanleenenianus TaxID=2268995 RepID=UPI003EC98B80